MAWQVAARRAGLLWMLLATAWVVVVLVPFATPPRDSRMLLLLAGLFAALPLLAVASFVAQAKGWRHAPVWSGALLVLLLALGPGAEWLFPGAMLLALPHLASVRFTPRIGGLLAALLAAPAMMGSLGLGVAAMDPCIDLSFISRGDAVYSSPQHSVDLASNQPDPCPEWVGMTGFWEDAVAALVLAGAAIAAAARWSWPASRAFGVSAYILFFTAAAIAVSVASHGGVLPSTFLVALTGMLLILMPSLELWRPAPSPPASTSPA